MSSPSFTPASPSNYQRPEAAPTMPDSAPQTPNNMNAATVDTTLESDLPDDPAERSTGTWAKVMNNKWTPAPRRSKLQADVKYHCPDFLEYYEGRRNGKIEAKAFEDWGEPVYWDEEDKLYHIEHDKARGVFFEMDYNRGFTGRGGELALCAHTSMLLTDEVTVLPASLERPGLLGPRNETVEEIAGPASGLKWEQPDRPLWQAVDKKSRCPPEMSKEVDDVGPLGEWIDVDVCSFG